MLINKGETSIVLDEASIKCVYQDTLNVQLAGTFGLVYADVFTSPVNANINAMNMRYALEALKAIETIAVHRTFSSHVIPIAGRIDVLHGQIFGSCSLNQNCDFMHAMYGIPGCLINLGNKW